VPWLWLILAGLLEVIWAVTLKRTDGLTRPGPSLFTLATMIGSFYLLSQSMRTLPVGTAYAVWVGIGAAGTAVIGLLFLGEPKTTVRLISLALILLGVFGLRWAEGW
jgi:quaternary ammonium compound-resistance protein SugE